MDTIKQELGRTAPRAEEHDASGGKLVTKRNGTNAHANKIEIAQKNEASTEARRPGNWLTFSNALPASMFDEE